MQKSQESVLFHTYSLPSYILLRQVLDYKTGTYLRRVSSGLSGIIY